MSTFHKLLGLSAAVLLAVPLAASAITDAERQAGRQSVANQPMPVAMAAPDARMVAMRDMRDRMAAARTPEERQALMADHMKAMQNGMQMMKTAPGMPGMSGMSGMGPMGGMGGMADGSGRPAKDAKHAAKGMPHNMAGHMAMHHQMMESRMDAMQTMMDMMVQRMAPADTTVR